MVSGLLYDRKRALRFRRIRETFVCLRPGCSVNSSRGDLLLVDPAPKPVMTPLPP